MGDAPGNVPGGCVGGQNFFVKIPVSLLTIYHI